MGCQRWRGWPHDIWILEDKVLRLTVVGAGGTCFAVLNVCVRLLLRAAYTLPWGMGWSKGKTKSLCKMGL